MWDKIRNNKIKYKPLPFYWGKLFFIELKWFTRIARSRIDASKEVRMELPEIHLYDYINFHVCSNLLLVLILWPYVW